MEKFESGQTSEKSSMGKWEKFVFGSAQHADSLLDQLRPRYQSGKLFERAIKKAHSDLADPEGYFEEVYVPNLGESKVVEYLKEVWAHAEEQATSTDEMDQQAARMGQEYLCEEIENLVKALQKLETQSPEEIDYDNQAEERDYQKNLQEQELFDKACESFEGAGWKLFEGFNRKANEPEGSIATIAKPNCSFYNPEAFKGLKLFIYTGEVQPPEGSWSNRWIVKVINGIWLPIKSEWLENSGETEDMDYKNNHNDLFHDTRRFYSDEEFDALMEERGNAWPPVGWE